MDLRAHLEEDMIAFLDTRLSVDFLREQSTQPIRAEDTAGLFGKDYEKLLFTALQDHNIAKAKKLLHELKDEFSTLPEGSPERKQLHALLHVLYNKFKKYIEGENTLNKMERAIDTIDSPDIARKQLVGDLDAFAYGRAETTEESVDAAPTKKVTGEEEIFNPTESDLIATIHFLDEALAQKEIEQSRKYYQQAQVLFSKLSQTQQQRHYDHMLHYHRAISGLINHTTEPSVTQTEQDLVAAMKAGDLHEAMLHYEELREEAMNLSPAERKEHIPRMQQYHKWILSAWNQWQVDHQTAQPSALEEHERRLSGRP